MELKDKIAENGATQVKYLKMAHKYIFIYSRSTTGYSKFKMFQYLFYRWWGVLWVLRRCLLGDWRGSGRIWSGSYCHLMLGCGIQGGSTRILLLYLEPLHRHASALDLYRLGTGLLRKITHKHRSVKVFILSVIHDASVDSFLTLISLAVVQSMWVDAVTSGCCILQVDDHSVSFLSHEQRSHITQPIWFHHLCPVGGVTVLLINSLLVCGANTLGAPL